MAEGQVTEEMGMHFLGVLSRPCQPETNRHLGMPEEQLSIGDGQTKIDRQQYLGHLRGWRAQTIERRAQATRKAFATRLAEQLLRLIGTALAIFHQCMEGGIGVAMIITVRVGAGIPRRANCLAPTARTFPFTPRDAAGAPALRWLPHSGVGWGRPHARQSFGVRGLRGRGVLRWEGVLAAGAGWRVARCRWRPTRTSAPNRPNHIRFS